MDLLIVGTIYFIVARIIWDSRPKGTLKIKKHLIKSIIWPIKLVTILIIKLAKWIAVNG